ncbi:MAG: hypothetical protein HW412_2163, partial [Bacteroidetes bacterium]|nr:hypothetical protein [Bacteroidota bacterium]
MTSGKTGIFDRRLLTLLASSFAFKVILLHTFPAIYGADPVGRLLHRNELFFSYWLPGLQAVILA